MVIMMGSKGFQRRGPYWVGHHRIYFARGYQNSLGFTWKGKTRAPTPLEGAQEAMILCTLRVQIRGLSSISSRIQPQPLCCTASAFCVSPEQEHLPEGPSTQCLRFLVPRTMPGRASGARSLKYWVRGPSVMGFPTTPFYTTPQGSPELSFIRAN